MGTQPQSPPDRQQPPTVLRLQLGAGLGRHQAGHEAVVGGRRGRTGDGGGGGSGPGATRGWAGDRGDLACGSHVLGGQLGIQLDAIQPDLGRAARLTLVLHSCRDTVASTTATSHGHLPPPRVPPRSPSLFMPACRHFLSRQAWHWLRCALSTGHSPVPAWHLRGEVAPGCARRAGPVPPRGVPYWEHFVPAGCLVP